MEISGIEWIGSNGEDGFYSSPSHQSNAQRWGIRHPAEKSKDGAKRRGRLLNDGDARDRMYFYPFGVKRILHQTADHANMRADSGEIDLVRETLARGLSIGLSYREFADDFEDQVAAFGAYVSCVQQILKLRIQFEPSVGVAVGFMADSVWFRTVGGVNKCARPPRCTVASRSNQQGDRRASTDCRHIPSPV
jgi:hypothetical protein